MGVRFILCLLVSFCEVSFVKTTMEQVFSIVYIFPVYSVCMHVKAYGDPVVVCILHLSATNILKIYLMYGNFS